MRAPLLARCCGVILAAAFCPCRFAPQAPPIEPLPESETAGLLAGIDRGEQIRAGALHRALHSSQLTLRARAAMALGTQGDRSSIAFLIDALSDMSSHVGAGYTAPGLETTRYWASESLKRLAVRDFGFVWNAPERESKETTDRWKDWYLGRDR
ncbi:MAG: hypothetical protein AB1640_06700 [bacterium]